METPRPSQIRKFSTSPDRAVDRTAGRAVGPDAGHVIDTWRSVIPAAWAEPTGQKPFPNAVSETERLGCELNPQQLELMYNWCNKASLTMALDESEARRTFWGSVVPALALEHPFLMRALLAVSAAHIAYDRPEARDSFLPIARLHQVLGYGLFQHLNVPESPSRINSHHEAKVIFIVMNITLPLALAERTGRAEDVLETFVEWLIFLRSSCKLAHSFYDEHLKHVPNHVSALLRRAEDGPRKLSMLDEGLTASLHLLETANRADTTTLPAEKEHITNTIEKIKLWSRLVSIRPPTPVFLATCAVDIGDEFFRLVKKKNPVSLIAMAHFLIPMRHAPRRWFWGDWFDAAIAAILHVLPIGDWHHNLRWVIEQADMSHLSVQRPADGTGMSL